jgi:isoquinoline 1-oxidoreductase subunit beta
MHRGLAQHDGLRQLRRGGGRNLGRPDNGNKVKVHRIVAATDTGHVVNPAQIERQVAGSFVYGLSALFMEGCTVKDGASSRRISTPTTRCASRRCRRSSRSHAGRQRASGAASASRPSASRRRPCSTRSCKATGKRIRTVPLKNHGINVIDVKLGPRAGKAEFATRIRLADTQHVTAICQLSDGTFWSDSKHVIITLGACLEGAV